MDGKLGNGEKGLVNEKAFAQKNDEKAIGNEKELVRTHVRLVRHDERVGEKLYEKVVPRNEGELERCGGEAYENEMNGDLERRENEESLENEILVGHGVEKSDGD